MTTQNGTSWRRKQRLFDNAVYRILDKDVKLEIYEHDDDMSYYNVYVRHDVWMYASEISFAHDETDSEIKSQLYSVVRKFKDGHRTEIPEGYEIVVKDHVATLNYFSEDPTTYCVFLYDKDGYEYDDFFEEVSDSMTMTEIHEYVETAVRNFLKFKNTKEC